MAQRSQNKFSSIDQIATKFKKVLVIGMGQLGLPVAKYVLSRGIETYVSTLTYKQWNVHTNMG